MKVIKGNEEFHKFVFGYPDNYFHEGLFIKDVTEMPSLMPAGTKDLSLKQLRIRDSVLKGWNMESPVEIILTGTNEIRNCSFKELIARKSLYDKKEGCFVRNCKIEELVEKECPFLVVMSCEIGTTTYPRKSRFYGCSIDKLYITYNNSIISKKFNSCKIKTIIIYHTIFSRKPLFFDQLYDLSREGTVVEIYDSSFELDLKDKIFDNFYFFNTAFSTGSLTNCDFSKTAHFSENDNSHRGRNYYDHNIKIKNGVSVEGTDFGDFTIEKNAYDMRLYRD